MSTTSAPAESVPTMPVGPGHRQHALSRPADQQAAKNEPVREPEQHSALQAQTRTQPEIHHPAQQQQQQPNFHQPPAQHHPNFHQPGPHLSHSGPQQPGLHQHHHPALYHPGIHHHGMYQPPMHQQQGMYPPGLPPGLHPQSLHHLESQQPGTQPPYYQPAPQQPGPPFQHPRPHPHPQPHPHPHPHPQQPAPPTPQDQPPNHQPPQQNPRQKKQRPPKTPPHTPRHRYLTRDQRLQIMTLHSAGHTQLFIANQLGITSRQVGYTIRSGSLTPKKRSGRPQKLSEAQCDQLDAFVSGTGPAPSGTNEEGWEEGRYMSYEKLAKGPFADWGVGEYAVRGVLRKRGYVRIGRELVKRAPNEFKARQRVRKPKSTDSTPTTAMEEDEEDDEEDEDDHDEENDDDGEGDEDDAIIEGRPAPALSSGAPMHPNAGAHTIPRDFSIGVGNGAMGQLAPIAPAEAPSSSENMRTSIPMGANPELQQVS